MNLKNSSIAINWIDAPDQAWKEDNSVDIPMTWHTQTSVMAVTYDPLQDTYSFKIDHRGDTAEYVASRQVLEEPEVILTLLELLLNKAGLRWGTDPVPKKLVEQWIDKILVNPPAQDDFWGGAFSKKQAHQANTQMAAYAAGWPDEKECVPTSALALELPGVCERVMHPMRNIEYRLSDIIMSLNDEYKWTREQIADWVETLDVDTTFKTLEDA